jgi:transcriptional regulator with XRE-family HTH domain
MAQTRLRNTAEIREAQLRQGPEFRASWERTALARAVALALIGYRVKHHLTQTQLAEKLGVRQPQVARLEMGEHTPSLEMLQRLARTLGLRFIVEVAPAGEGAPESAVTLPAGVEVVEDVTADGSRILIATG